MANFFKCCHECKPPKRKTACWGHCPEYKAERAAYDEKMDAEKARRRLANALNTETGRQVARANRRRRGGLRMSGGLLRVGAQIIRPDPDSQYRLTPCKCGYGDVAYTRKITYHGVEWVAGCLTCERCTRVWTTQHAAQIEWNGKDPPSWERD